MTKVKNGNPINHWTELPFQNCREEEIDEIRAYRDRMKESRHGEETEVTIIKSSKAQRKHNEQLTRRKSTQTLVGGGGSGVDIPRRGSCPSDSLPRAS